MIFFLCPAFEPLTLHILYIIITNWTKFVGTENLWSNKWEITQDAKVQKIVNHITNRINEYLKHINMWPNQNCLFRYISPMKFLKKKKKSNEIYKVLKSKVLIRRKSPIKFMKHVI